MTDAAGTTFVYVTFIRTTPEQLWAALTGADFMKQYWFGMHHQTDWKAGSPWRLVFPDGRVPTPARLSRSIRRGASC